jgi:hypothetical protein
MRIPANQRHIQAPIEVSAGWLCEFMFGPTKYSQFSQTVVACQKK